MVDTYSADSPLEAAAGVTGARATEAFSVLGNETRLAILLTLWEAFEPWSEETAVRFSELRKCVGMRDKGQFNYHLKRLVGHFVRKTDDGYELQRAGHQVVQTVIAGTGIEDPAFDVTEVNRECTVCGAPTAITYHEERLFHVCTECEGRFGARGQLPEGTLAAADIDPAGVTDREPEELLNASIIRGVCHLQSALKGVCDACSGPMESWLHVCDDHPAEGMCPACERRYVVMARFRCPVCKHYRQFVPSCSWLVINHPAVVSFYYDHGIPLRYEGDVDLDHELIARNPPRVRVTIRYEGDELALTLDEELSVFAVSGRE